MRPIILDTHFSCTVRNGVLEYVPSTSRRGVSSLLVESTTPGLVICNSNPHRDSYSTASQTTTLKNESSSRASTPLLQSTVLSYAVQICSRPVRHTARTCGMSRGGTISSPLSSSIQHVPLPIVKHIVRCRVRPYYKSTSHD